MLPATPPNAEGDLGQTPYAHLAVYALDRRLTGEMFFIESEDVVHALVFERGRPVKIRMGDGYARLGELLVDEGLVTADAIEGAVMTGGLLGDVLVLAGVVESAALNSVLERQFKARITHLFELPPETKYKFFEGSTTLKDYGGEAANCDPLALLWQGVREHGEKAASFEPTLEKLAGVPLKLHARATLSKFCFEEDAQLVTEVLRLDATPLSDLLDLEGVSPDIANKFVYALAISRQLDLGRGTLPVGVEQRSSSLAKVQLKSQVHRAGAALDLPHQGDGERSVRTVRGRAIIPRDDDAPVPSSVAPSSPRNLSAPPLSAADGPVVETEETDIDPALLEEDSYGGADEVAAGEQPEEAAVLPEAEGGAESDRAPDTTASAGAAVANGHATNGTSIEAAEEIPEAPPAEESSRRLVSDTVKAMPVEALLKLAREKIHEKEAATATEVCEIARQRLEDEGKADSAIGVEVSALRCWSRSLEPHPDLKGLTVELDDLIRADDGHATVRYVRGILRKRLGNEAGSLSDFRRVVEIEPDHPGARQELSAAPKSIKPGETGFLKRLFRR